MNRFANCIKVVVLILTLLTTNIALATDGKWVFRGLPSYFSTASGKSAATATLPLPLGQETISQGIEGAPGFGISIEYLWSERIGIEGAAFLSSHDSDMLISNDLGTFAATDSTRFRTFTLGANYHLQTEGRAQWSLGGFVPLMFADGTNHVFPGLNRTEGRAYDQDYGLGVKGGMDWSFAPDSPWMLTIEGRYMFLLIMESETAGDVDVDPLVLSIGIGYRF
jgi:outer membrane protein W